MLNIPRIVIQNNDMEDALACLGAMNPSGRALFVPTDGGLRTAGGTADWPTARTGEDLTATFEEWEASWMLALLGVAELFRGWNPAPIVEVRPAGFYVGPECILPVVIQVDAQTVPLDCTVPTEELAPHCGRCGSFELKENSCGQCGWSNKADDDA